MSDEKQGQGEQAEQFGSLRTLRELEREYGKPVESEVDKISKPPVVTNEWLARLKGKHVGPDVTALIEEVERLRSLKTYIRVIEEVKIMRAEKEVLVSNLEAEEFINRQLGKENEELRIELAALQERTRHFKGLV